MAPESFDAELVAFAVITFEYFDAEKVVEPAVTVNEIKGGAVTLTEVDEVIDPRVAFTTPLVGSDGALKVV